MAVEDVVAARLAWIGRRAARLGQGSAVNDGRTASAHSRPGGAVHAGRCCRRRARQPTTSRRCRTSKEAFAAAYNLDHEPRSRSRGGRWRWDRTSSRAHRGLASILWLNILFDRGAVTVDHYMGSITKSKVTLPKPDPAARRGIQARGRARNRARGSAAQEQSARPPGQVRRRRGLRRAGVLRRRRSRAA